MKHLLFLYCLLALTSCGDSVERSKLVLTTTPETHYQDLGFGVSAPVPTFFRPARTYNGYQHPSGVGAVSLKLQPYPIETVVANYNPDAVEARGNEPLEYRFVDYNGNDRALFVKIYNPRKDTYRFILTVQQNDRTYAIKAWCFSDALEAFGDDLRNAVLSAHIGDYVEERPFLRVEMDDGSLAFTRDGIFPTLAEDEALLQVTPYEDRQVRGEDDVRAIIAQELLVHTQSAPTDLNVRQLDNGTFGWGIAYGEGRSAYVALMQMTGGTQLIVGTATTGEAAREMANYMNNELVSHTVR